MQDTQCRTACYISGHETAKNSNWTFTDENYYITVPTSVSTYEVFQAYCGK